MVSLSKKIKYLETIFKPKPHLPNVDWVLFKNGSVAILDPASSKEQLIEEAYKELRVYAGIGSGAGSSFGDFQSRSQENLFPGENVWMIVFNSTTIVTLVVFDEESSPLEAGLYGRNARSLDADDPIIVATSLD